MHICFSWLYMSVLNKERWFEIRTENKRLSELSPKRMGGIKHKARIRHNPTSHSYHMPAAWRHSKSETDQKDTTHDYSLLWEDEAFFVVQKRKLIRTDQGSLGMSACLQQHTVLSGVSDRKLTVCLCMKHAKTSQGWSRGSNWVTIYGPLWTSRLPLRN